MVPIFLQHSTDSGQAVIAAVGLQPTGGEAAAELPIATLVFDQRGRADESLQMTYTLHGPDGGEIEMVTVQMMMKNLLPREFSLHQNYPNPFNPVTTLRFELPNESNVALAIYDLRGREVVRLADGHLQAGYHQYQWAGRNRGGRILHSGIYFARLVAQGYVKTIKMLLIK